MKKSILFLLVLLALAAGVWRYQSMRTAPDTASGDDADKINLPPDWAHSVYGEATVAGISHNENNVVMEASGAGLNDEHHDFAWIYRESDKPFDAQARVTLDAATPAEGGAGWMIRAGLEPESPFVSVFRDGLGRMMVKVSAMPDRPAVAREVKNTAGHEYLRIIVDGTVLKASCSLDGATWPVAENISIPWLTNRVMIGCAAFSGDPLLVTRANFFGLHVSPR